MHGSVRHRAARHSAAALARHRAVSHSAARHSAARHRATALALAALALAIITAGCSSAGPAASAGSGSPVATPTGALPTEAPTPTAWPGNVPDAVIALGKLDEQMAKAATAMDDAVSAEDFAALSAASQGLVDLVDGYSENLQTIQGYAGTRQLGDTFAEALGKIRTGAQAIVDGIEKGDAAAIDAGVTDLGAGIAQYGLARKALGPFLEQAISMKKKYVK